MKYPERMRITLLYAIGCSKDPVPNYALFNMFAYDPSKNLFNFHSVETFNQALTELELSKYIVNTEHGYTITRRGKLSRLFHIIFDIDKFLHPRISGIEI